MRQKHYIKMKENRCEIAIINGTLGVGKTETSWEIMNMIQPAAVIDIDYLYAFKPKDYADKSQRQHVYEAVALLLNHHQKLSIHRFIINGVFGTPANLAHLRSAIASVTDNVKAYRLVCHPAEVNKRIQNRNAPGWQEHLERSAYMAAAQDANENRDEIGKQIDTTTRSIEETATAVIQDMQSCGFWTVYDNHNF